MSDPVFSQFALSGRAKSASSSLQFCVAASNHIADKNLTICRHFRQLVSVRRPTLALIRTAAACTHSPKPAAHCRTPRSCGLAGAETASGTTWQLARLMVDRHRRRSVYNGGKETTLPRARRPVVRPI